MFFDGHADTAKRIVLSGSDFLRDSPAVQVDLPRAREGDMIGGLFSIEVPPVTQAERASDYGLTLTPDSWHVRLADPIPQDYAERFTTQVRDTFLGSLTHDDRARLVRTTGELQTCVRDGVFAVVLHYEGAEAIKPDLANLADHYEHGLRSLGLVWSRPNAFGCGAAFDYPSGPAKGPGLTGAGFALVRACDELGILIDLAHISDSGFWDVANATTRPLVVTHAGAQAVCPSATNLTDAQIDAVGRSGGMIGVLFDVVNVRSDGRDCMDTPLSQIVAHAVYLANRVGVDHVGFGSDFDGGLLPSGLDSAAKLPALDAALSDAGFDDAEIAKLTHENWLRTLCRAWKE
jgi:membrane dipeptidase